LNNDLVKFNSEKRKHKKDYEGQKEILLNQKEEMDNYKNTLDKEKRSKIKLIKDFDNLKYD